MQELLTRIIDVIFPPTAEARLLRTVSPSAIAACYQPGRHQTITYLCPYQNNIVQAAVTENKFHHSQHGAQLLAHWLEQWLRDTSATADTVFVPIPLGKKRQRERGHNQVETVLRTVQPSLLCDSKLLTRSTETAPQSHLPKRERLQNVRHAFTYHPHTLPEHVTHLVLVDDVVTTGATMVAARSVLAPHLPPHIKITCLAVAH